MNAQSGDSIYVRGLKWAHSKQKNGFKKEEFRAALNITDEEWDWAEWLFFNGIAGDSPLIWTPLNEYLRHGQTWGETWYLSPTGVAAATNYLELKEAQRSGKMALAVALIAIVINVIVGGFEIYYEMHPVPVTTQPVLQVQQSYLKGWRSFKPLCHLYL